MAAGIAIMGVAVVAVVEALAVYKARWEASGYHRVPLLFRPHPRHRLHFSTTLHSPSLITPGLDPPHLCWRFRIATPVFDSTRSLLDL